MQVLIKITGYGPVADSATASLESAFNALRDAAKAAGFELTKADFVASNPNVPAEVPREMLPSIPTSDVSHPQHPQHHEAKSDVSPLHHEPKSPRGPAPDLRPESSRTKGPAPGDFR